MTTDEEKITALRALLETFDADIMRAILADLEASRPTPPITGSATQPGDAERRVNQKMKAQWDATGCVGPADMERFRQEVAAEAASPQSGDAESDPFPKCERDFVGCAYPACECFREVGGIITDDRVFVKCMREAWANSDADPTGMIARFLRLLDTTQSAIAESQAEVAQLTQDRDAWEREARASRAELDRLARLRSPTPTGEDREAGNLAQQLIDSANREGVDTYTRTLLWHASSLIDRQSAALAGATFRSDNADSALLQE